MYDNAMYAAIIPVIEAGLTQQGVTGFEVAQSYQPTQQGVNTNKTVYIHKLFDNPYGWVARNAEWVELEAKEIHSEVQWNEATFQVSTLLTENPADDLELTASDLANLVRMVIQSDIALAAFSAINLGLLRPSEVRNPRFLDDRNRFEASPSFDFTLTDDQLLQYEIPTVNEFKSGFFRV